MKKLFILVVFALGFGYSSGLSAQNYSSAVGIRLGVPWSISYKMFISDLAAIEVYGSFRSNRATVSGLDAGWTSIGINGAYLIHNEFSNTEGLTWYYGGGGSVYFWSYADLYTGTRGNVTFGVSGYLGLDYKFGNAPVNISVDWVPTFYIGSALGGFGAGQGALAVRYVLGE